MGRFADLLTQNRWKRALVNQATGYRRDIARAYAEALRLEHAGEEQIREHQERGLRALLAVASRSPYYGPLLAASGKRPEDYTLADLRGLPFLTKEILREREGDLAVPGSRGSTLNFSGGSTGIPTRFLQGYQYRVHMSVATRRCNEMAGAFPGARVAKLWGAPQDRRKIEGLLGRAKLWMLNMRYYDSFDMGPERMERYHREMERFQPDLILAYASSIYLLARFLASRGIRPAYPTRSIISAAEKLFPHMRAEIERVFGVRVFDRYGSREVSAMAAECEAHDGLHIHMPGYIVETVDPATGAPVEETPGEIAITVLHNYSMPFIRYRVGDMGVLTRARCSCGRSFWRLREVVGRTSDNFLMPDGRIVHGEYFTHLFYNRDGIRQFQFVQDNPRSFTLRVVPAAGYGPDLAGRIERDIRAVIGPEPALRVEEHEQIPPTASGKYRFTVSHVSVDDLVGGNAR